jgi:hypothetical protein
MSSIIHSFAPVLPFFFSKYFRYPYFPFCTSKYYPFLLGYSLHLYFYQTTPIILSQTYKSYSIYILRSNHFFFFNPFVPMSPFNHVVGLGCKLLYTGGGLVTFVSIFNCKFISVSVTCFAPERFFFSSLLMKV